MQVAMWVYKQGRKHQKLNFLEECSREDRFSNESTVRGGKKIEKILIRNKPEGRRRVEYLVVRR